MKPGESGPSGMEWGELETPNRNQERPSLHVRYSIQLSEEAREALAAKMTEGHQALMEELAVLVERGAARLLLNVAEEEPERSALQDAIRLAFGSGSYRAWSTYRGPGEPLGIVHTFIPSEVRISRGTEEQLLEEYERAFHPRLRSPRWLHSSSDDSF